MKFSWIRRKKQNGQREGASLVSVVIGVLFLSAIGVTILTVATRYVVSVYTAGHSSNNFYETEGILTEVRTGLIGYASAASRDSYEDVLQNYMADGADAKMKYSERYMNRLVEKLTGRTGFQVASEVNKSNPAKSYQAENGAPLANINKLTQVPDAVKTDLSTKENYFDFDIRFDELRGYTLILKNIDIDYTNEASYRSQISTDIVFTTPDYKFDGDSTFNELKNYLVISDGILKRSGVNSSGTTFFTGNIYTGGASVKGSGEKPDIGIDIQHDKKVVFQSDRIISRGSLDIQSGSDIVVKGDSGTADPVAGDLWLQNVRLKNYNSSQKGTILKIFENAYVSNDLDIEDNNSEVYLAGTYYGYSYNEQNLSSEAATNAEYSSAVLVNGLNTSLFTNWDPSKDGTAAAASIPTLDKLVLAGHTFVERETNAANKGNDDIVMGESIAAKSDQIAYLVPDDYVIGPEHNPVMAADYEDKAVFLAGVKNALNNSPLKDYLNSAQPYIENHISVSGEDVMYLFLNFKNISVANQYYFDYFAGNIVDSSLPEDSSAVANRDLLKDKAQTYLRVSNMGATFSPNLYLLAGYVAYNYEATDAAKGLQAPNYFTNNGTNSKPKETLLEDARKMANSYYAFCKSLTSSAAGTGEAKRIKNNEEKLVADTILDMSKLNASEVIKNTTDRSKVLVEAVDGNYSTSALMDTAVQGKDVRGILVAKGDVVVDKSFRGLIIAGGEVTVESDFDGLILSEDHVDVTLDKKLTANIVVVNELLDHIKTDPALTAIFNALNGKVSEDATELEECISYQNWLKDPGTIAAE